MRAPRLATMTLLLALVLGVAPARAGEPSATEKDTARSLMWSGDQAFARGEHADALRSYLSADEIMRVPTTGVAVARARAALGQLVEARDRALVVARSTPLPDEPPVYLKARDEAAKLAADLLERIPTLRITVEGSRDVEVLVDGLRVPAAVAAAGLKVNPTMHRVRVRAPGHHDAEASVALAEGATETARLVLRAEAPGVASAVPRHDARTAPFPGRSRASDAAVPLMVTGFSVAGAALVAGAVTGGLSLSRSAELEDRCGAGPCGPEDEDDLSSANTLANVSNVAFAVAGVGLVVGFVGVVLRGSARDPTAASSAARASARGVTWSF
jgi:hypothetical protein